MGAGSTAVAMAAEVHGSIADKRLYRKTFAWGRKSQSLGFLPRTAVSFSVILLSDLRVECRLRLLLRAQGAETSSRTRRLSMIHPTAVIDRNAELDSDVKV